MTAIQKRGRTGLRNAALRMASTLIFSGSIATTVVWLGTRDLESYDHSLFSLDRGTAATSVQVLGQPVYTLAVGFGVRLPLHGSLGASPAARLARHLPVPLTYWFLITFGIAVAAAIMRHALEPLCGRLITWLAVILQFWSVPVANYTFFDDWPETALTYCACVACVYAPHAMLATGRWGAGFAAIAAGALVSAAHPGYWPLLAVAVTLSGILALVRSEYGVRRRVVVVTVCGVAALLSVAPQIPDIWRELDVARAHGGDLSRFVGRIEGDFVSANLFPWAPHAGVRAPFTYLVLALVSVLIGVRSKDTQARRVIVGSALLSVMLGVAAAEASLQASPSPYEPTAMWALRDPAIGFAVFGAAIAAGVVRGMRGGPWIARIALVLAAAQGLAYATTPVIAEGLQPRHDPSWNQDMAPVEARLDRRGLTRDRVQPGERMALWLGIADAMRNKRRASTDFADAGNPLVTVWTKQRTMSGLVEPNGPLFDQTTELSPELLCDEDAVRFLRLRYLLMPLDIDCAPWVPLPDLVVDGEWVMATNVARATDERVFAIPVATLTEPMTRVPALSVRSDLLATLVPLPDSVVRLTTRGIALRFADVSVAQRQALVLPVAYDSSWRTSSGHTREVGGLLALTGVDQRHVTLEFAPDVTAILRAVSMTVAQILAVIGFLGLAYVGPVTREYTRMTIDPRMARVVGIVRAALWPYVAVAGAVIWSVSWGAAADADARTLVRPLVLVLLLTALVVGYFAQRTTLHRIAGVALYGGGMLRVAMGGSLSAYALQDPLFWGVVSAAMAIGVALIARWTRASRVMAALAGAAVAIAILLPALPGSESPRGLVDVITISQGWSDLSDRVGALGAIVLVGLWLRASIRGCTGSTRIVAVAGGALIAALVLVSVHGVPTVTSMEWMWMAACGAVLGLAEPPQTGSSAITSRDLSTTEGDDRADA